MIVGFIEELVGPFVSVAVGFGLGAVALLVMLGVRRAQARVSRLVEIEDPDGGVWSVRVVYGLRRTLSTRLTGMSVEARRGRRSAGWSDSAVGRDEIWHPRRVVEHFDEAAGLVAPFIVIAVLLIAVVFVVELLIAVPVGIAVFVVSTIRGRWRVEVTTPGGARTIVECASLGEARETRTRMAERIAGGFDPLAG